MIPERNGISRLDEMTSGVAGVDMIIEWFIYSYSYNSYVLQIVDVARLSFRVELPARCCCAVFYSQLAPKVTRTRSVQTVVYLECHVVSFEYFRVIVQYNNRLYIIPLLLTVCTVVKSKGKISPSPCGLLRIYEL